MKRKKYRGIQTPVFVMYILLGCVFGGFGCFALYGIPKGMYPEELVIPLGFLNLCVLLFGIYVLVFAIYSFLSYVTFDECLVIYHSPFVKKSFPISKIKVFGCAAYAPRSAILFFSTADLGQMEAFAEKNRISFSRAYFHNKAVIEQLKATEKGTQRMLIGTYIFGCMRHKNTDTIILRSCTAHRLAEIVRIMNKDAELVGPWMEMCRDALLPYSALRGTELWGRR